MDRTIKVEVDAIPMWLMERDGSLIFVDDTHQQVHAITARSAVVIANSEASKCPDWIRRLAQLYAVQVIPDRK